MKNIPWWLKLLGKIILSRLPIGYPFWQKIGLFRHGLMDSKDYAIRIFDQHLARSGYAENLKGKVILEVGPGDSIATALIASAHGAKAILVDVGPFASVDIEYYLSICKLLQDRGLNAPEIRGFRNLAAILNACNAQYMTDGLNSLRTIESNSVDVIYSHAVLEHIRASIFADTVAEWKRILKPMGCCSHNVDLKDHLGGGLNNLRFSSTLWESEFFANSGFYTNRISYGEMLKYFTECGFEADHLASKKWATLPIKHKSIAKEFRSRTKEDLCTKEFNVRLRRAT